MLLYIGFVVIGGLLFIFSIRRLRGKINFVQNAERATGRVVQLEEINDSGGLFYRPVFEFTTRNNTVIMYRHSTSFSNPKHWPIGTIQTFIYDAAEPTAARFLNYSLFKFSILLLAVSIALMVIGAGYFLFSVWYGYNF